MTHLSSLSRQFPLTRLRRLRQNDAIREILTEHQIKPSDLIYPMFVREGCNLREPILSMPGIERMSLDILAQEAQTAYGLGIRAIALFPVIEPSQKTEWAQEAYQDQGLIQRAIRAVKAACPELLVVGDVALDPYTLHGQDGIVDACGTVLNDETLEILVKQALAQAHAGADIIAPSDMMDGRIGAIRQALEASGFHNTLLLSYAAKYASSFYGPFREAVGSQTQLGKSHKKSYQMNPANAREALHEVALDLQEGADIVMIKPGLPYLDIIYQVKQTFQVPTFAYQVSGEYAMLKAASHHGWLDEEKTVLESLISLKRAGCDAVLTYYAKQVAQWLAQ